MAKCYSFQDSAYRTEETHGQWICRYILVSASTFAGESTLGFQPLLGKRF
ncbi:MAG: hypothetical protein WCA35_10835 [Kovacikia sp.]